LNAALKVAQPVMAYTADNFTKEQAYELYDVARKEFDNVVASLKPFGFIFAEGILDRIVDMKDKDINVKVMKELMGDDTNDQSILDFSK
jgi:hypothetical protein